MENEIVKPAFDYGVVPESSRELVKIKTVETKMLVRQTALGIIDIGKNLIEVKQAIGHGNWLPWLDAEFGWSRKTAHRFIQVSESFSNVPRVGHLDIAPKALYLLSQNSTPEEVRQEAIEMAESGETPTAKEIKELKAKNKELNDLIQQQSETKAPDINNLIPKLKELLDSESISESVALAYSQLPVEVQETQYSLELSRQKAIKRSLDLEESLRRIENRDIEAEIDDKVEEKLFDKIGKISEKIRSEVEEELKQAKKAALDAKKEVDESLRESIRVELQKEVDKAKTAQEKSEREKKQALESMAAAHKETARLARENEDLKKQTESSSPGMVDNKWASMLEKQGKDLMDYITLMTNDMDRSGAFPSASVEVLTNIMHKLSEELDRIENNAIIEIS